MLEHRLQEVTYELTQTRKEEEKYAKLVKARNELLRLLVRE